MEAWSRGAEVSRDPGVASPRGGNSLGWLTCSCGDGTGGKRYPESRNGNFSLFGLLLSAFTLDESACLWHTIQRI